MSTNLGDRAARRRAEAYPSGKTPPHRRTYGPPVPEHSWTRGGAHRAPVLRDATVAEAPGEIVTGPGRSALPRCRPTSAHPTAARHAARAGVDAAAAGRVPVRVRSPAAGADGGREHRSATAA
ncbi:hypothetical protein GCM10020218_089900 [Dactylosporangium vinaceum]